MRDIAQLLAGLQLQQYLPLFEHHNIGADLLTDLTDADLQAIGIHSLGHRKYILRGIRQSGSGHQELSGRGERRQVTVLFCDLVGSTELSVRLDPEDMDQVIRQYQSAVTPLILQFGGTVARFVGDGILAYFGYPRASEHDPERAVRAALLAIDKVRTLRPLADLQLAVRIGIATGEVVVSELQWLDDNLQEPSAIGQPPNLAARLQGLAGPDSIVISASTHKLCGQVFLYERLDDSWLQGFDKAVQAWRVTGNRRVACRFEAIQTGRRFTRLCGREHEQQALLAAWHRAIAGHGNSVLLQGAAGVGKSRMVRILTDQLDLKPYSTLRFFCEPYQTDSALFPIIYQFQRLANFAAEDSVDHKLDQLEKYLAEWSEQCTAMMPLLAHSYGLSSSDRYPLSNLGATKLRQAIIDLFVDWLLAHAQSLPLLIVVEDLHWVDPSTEELLQVLSARLKPTNTLLLVTARPEFTSPLQHTSSIQLKPLDNRAGAAMIADITDGNALPDSAIHKILERADGVPLFIEELTRGASESLAQAADTNNTRTISLDHAVPASLQDSLMARLDRLGEVKRLAQTSAVIGRQFTRDVLQRVSHLSDDELDRALHLLIHEDLLAQLPGTSTSRFVFKHALVRDAAYNSLLRSDRQELHSKVADALIEHFPTSVKSRPQMVAAHFRDAARFADSTRYWTLAGKLASQSSATREAMEHLAQGSKVLALVADPVRKKSLELGLLIARGPALIATKGYSSSAVHETYQRAAQLIDSATEPPEMAMVLSGLWAFRLVRGELSTATDYANQLLAIAADANNNDMLLEVHVMLGVTLSYTGPFELALQHARTAAQMYDSKRHGGHAVIYGQDPCMASTSYAAMALCGMGRLDQAGADADQAIAFARTLEHKRSLAFALANGARCHFKRGDYHRCKTLASEAVQLSGEFGYPDFLAMAKLHLAAASHQLHAERAALNDMRSSLDQLLAVGNSISSPYYHAITAFACAQHKHYDLAFEHLAQADTALARHGTDCDESEVWRLRGEVEKAHARDTRQPLKTARHSLQRAYQLASTQNAHLWQLRSATSLAQLTDVPDEQSRQRLSAALDMATEGHSLPCYQLAAATLFEQSSSA